jgi:hypothetical protein
MIMLRLRRDTADDLRLRRDLPPVALYDTLNDRKPHAGPLEIPIAIKAMEDREQAFRVSHVEARSVIDDAIHDLAAAWLAGHFDNGLRHAAREFKRVVLRSTQFGRQAQPDIAV